MWVSEDQIARSKGMDLLTYLHLYEPNELVHVRGNEYSTRTHDSLKISNGMWHWFSRGISGRTALDYLIHVKGMTFPNAVLLLAGDGERPTLPQDNHNPIKPSPTDLPFVTPLPYSDNRRAIEYLLSRGIDRDIIKYCIQAGTIYESTPYHNVVFTGFDESGVLRYATERSTLSGSTWRKDAAGSDKRFCFSLPAGKNHDTLLVFESAIDLISQATIDKMAGCYWQNVHRLSLGGVADRKPNSPLPLALGHYLERHPEIKNIQLCLDNDSAGRQGTAILMKMLNGSYRVCNTPSPEGKDYNDYLKQIVSHRQRSRREFVEER